MILVNRPIKQWPGELTKTRQVSNFSATWTATLELLEREIGFLTNGRNPSVALQTAIREQDIRLDGQTKAKARVPEHPGVILAFDSKLGPLQFSCDRFNDWQDNVRAIALGMESLRRVERYGLGTGTEQYRGWQALPPGTPMGAGGGQPPKLTVERANGVLAMSDGYDVGWLEDGSLELKDVERAYRTLARQYHPDTGSGNADQFRLIGQARDVMTEHLGSKS